MSEPASDGSFLRRVNDGTESGAEKLDRENSSKGECAVFIVSIPAWTQVRETIGGESADSLAQSIARRLQDCLRDFDAQNPGSFFVLRGAVAAGADCVHL